MLVAWMMVCYKVQLLDMGMSVSDMLLQKDVGIEIADTSGR